MFLVAPCPNRTLANGRIIQSIPEPYKGMYLQRFAVYFACDDGYVRNGTNVAVCRANQTWDRPLPECIGNNSVICFDCNLSYTLGPAYNEFGYYEHPPTTSRFLCIKIIDSNVNSSVTTSTLYNEQFSLYLVFFASICSL